MKNEFIVAVGFGHTVTTGWIRKHRLPPSNLQHSPATGSSETKFFNISITRIRAMVSLGVLSKSQSHLQKIRNILQQTDL